MCRPNKCLLVLYNHHRIINSTRPILMASTYYEIYRGSPAGNITEEFGRHVLIEFDRVLADVMATKVDSKASVKAHLHTYRHCDEVWYFSLRNASFKMDNKQVVTTPKIKVVACKHGDAVESTVGAPQSSPFKSSPMKRY
ncbi:transcription initiation factor IIA, gamma subunit-domain-containing protein [Mycena galericulata]|nr:transcription initiation factor IIA, gamma subunit-domain-containing protein [Mycena galericulata]